MHRLTILCLVITGLLMCLVGVDSQVTFSKGWGPGKRSLFEDPFNCKVNTQSLVTSYYRLIAELRQLIRCETRGWLPYLKPEGLGTTLDANALMAEQ